MHTIHIFIGRYGVLFSNIVSFLYSTRDDEKSSSSAFNISISFFPLPFIFTSSHFLCSHKKMRHSLSLKATKLLLLLWGVEVFAVAYCPLNL